MPSSSPTADPIDEFIALPRDQQLSTLQSLAPEKQDKLLAKIKERRSAKRPATDDFTIAPSSTGPMERTVGNYASEGVAGVGRGLKNDVVGLAGLLHPIDTFTGLRSQALQSVRAAQKGYAETDGTQGQKMAAGALGLLENAPVIGGMVQRAEEGGDKMGSPEAFGAAMEGVTTFEAPGAVGKMTKGLLNMRGVTGTGPKVTADLVKGAKAGNEAANAYSKVHSSIETARENALKVGNEKYSAVNEKLNPLPADAGGLRTALDAAKEKIKGAEKEPPIIKDLSSRLERNDYVYQGGQKFGPGTPLYESVKSSPEGLPGGESKALSYKDLQGYYSDLGKELSKGSLPGDTYAAYNDMHEAIGNEMQRIADSKGMGEQLGEARDYWRRMKQTFGKPQAKRDAATSTLNAVAPEMSKRDAMANRARNLGSFDPNIPSQLDELRRARKAAKGAPAVTPGETRKIGAEDVQKAKAESLGKRADWIEHRGTWAATWPVFHVMSSLMHGDVGSLGSTGLEMAGTYAAVRGVGAILRNPKVVEFLTKATEKDIAQIPPELRGDFPGIVNAAQKQGLAVSPLLLKAFGAAARGAAITGPQTQQLQEMRGNSVQTQ